MIDLNSLELLGRHVSGDWWRGGRAERLPRDSVSFFAAASPRRKTEVENFRAALRRHDDVVGLEVAVNDPDGVRFGERVGNLHGMLGGVPGVHRSARDYRLQCLSRHE